MQEIHYAASRGDIETVIEEIQNGADINHVDPRFTKAVPEYSPLMYAAKDPRADCDMLALLLDQGADIHQQTNHQTALSLAIRNSQVAKVKFLISKGADVHYISEGGFNVWLDAACSRSKNKDDLFDLLLGISGLNINQVSKNFSHICRILSDKCEFELLKKVLEAGASRKALKWTDVMWEIVFGTVDSVKKALPGADLKIGDSSERDAWLLSAVVGSIEKSNEILEAGAERLTMDRMGRDALHFAVEQDNATMVAWLIEIGMDINYRNIVGRTPLIVAANYGCVESMKVLLDYGADPTLGDLTSYRAISYASNIECVQLLVEKGEDPSCIPSDGYHLLTNATLDDDIEFVTELLNLGLDPDLNSNSETTLHKAIFGDKLEIAKILLEAGANPNQEDYDGETILHQCQSRKAIELMLEYGADPDCVCWGGDSPDEKYERFGRSDLAKYFRSIRSKQASCFNLLTPYTVAFSLSIPLT